MRGRGREGGRSEDDVRMITKKRSSTGLRLGPGQGNHEEQHHYWDAED